MKNKKLVMKQIQQHVGVNLEDEFNKDPESFMRYAKKFRKLGIKYLKFHGAENVSVHPKDSFLTDPIRVLFRLLICISFL